MKSIKEIELNPKIKIQETGADGGWAFIQLSRNQKPAMVVFSWGGGWDHVSVSYKNRCLTWDEMCMVKDMFFRSDECAVQYHPAKEDYINLHPFTLHLWRPQDKELPVPPKYMV